MTWATLPESAAETSEIAALYTPLTEAVEELERRRNNTDLRARIDNFHHSCFPTFMSAEPVGLLNRSIMTPNHEFDRFLSLLAGTKLVPLLVEFHQDVLVTYNPDKYRLGRQAFAITPDIARGMRVVDWKSFEGKPPPRISDVRTRNGLRLVDYHHALLETAYPGSEKHLVDFSSWFMEARRGEFYYLRYLALFIYHGILFENFVVKDESELRFTLEKVVPSFKKAVELFGVRPLIVPILPAETEHGDYWRSLPATLYPRACELLGAKA